ncbi:MAG: hypothetical protein PUC65_15360 [Clostridiales bacterium]|nr:hypothetical protein [Clostridiales bacterium]
MQVCERIINVTDYVTKSNLPASDYVINPYVGCPHGCKYCYACFMKPNLILRDLELLKQCKHLTVSMSINTLDEKFRADMDHASSIKDRLQTLKTLHDNGIYTILFMSPMFPEITNFRKIISASKEFVDEYWLENLNLRGSYKQTIMDYIKEQYPQLTSLYETIYVKRNMS